MNNSLKPGQAARLFYPDAIRALAMIGIVFLHVSSPIAQDFSGYSRTWWWIANAVYSCVRPSIALFVMISGMLLLAPGKEENIRTFFRKRFMRIGVPFLFWGMVYFCWKTRMQGPEFSLLQAVKDFIQGPVYYHLWFIYTITGIYLATPVFRVYVKNAPRSNLVYLLVLWLTGTSVYPLINHYTGLRIGIPIMVAGGFLGAFILGHFLHTLNMGKRLLLVSWAVLVLCCVFTAVLTFVLSSHTMAYNGLFEDFLSLNVVAMAISVFLIFKSISYDKIQKRLPVLIKAATLVSSASFSVYLMHILVLEVFKSHLPWFSLSAVTIHPLIGIPLTAAATLILCIVLIVPLRKIPYVKYILP
jgi:surface polysaccharide O-acyltransferase-like enzyme